MLLPNKLEKIWSELSFEEKLQAQTEARIILENLVHYSKRHGAYYVDDVTRLAAELVFFKKG